MSKKASSTVDQSKPQESKEDRFIRLAMRRVPRALKAMSHVARLGNRQSYACTVDQADKILAALGQAVEQVSDSLMHHDRNGQLFEL